MDFEIHIYNIRPSFEDDRIEIDFELEDNSEIDWDVVNQILDDEITRDQYEPFHVVIKDEEALDWDFYSLPGTLGLLSKKAKDIFESYCTDYFEFLDATINSIPYFLIKEFNTLKCLDREHSILIPFKSDPNNVMQIKKYVFYKELIKDPLIFSIPESSDIYATQSVAQIIRESSLQGFHFELLD